MATDSNAKLLLGLLRFGAGVGLQASVRALLKSAQLLTHMAELMHKAEAKPGTTWAELSEEDKAQWMQRARTALTALMSMVGG